MSTKDRIIDAAIKEFGEYSYDAASINRIIKESGTSKGTFYHYFRDKKDLYFSIFEKVGELKQEYLDRMMQRVKRKDDFFGVIKEQLRTIGEFMNEWPDMYKFGLMHVREHNEIKNEVHKKYITQVEGSFENVIRTAMDNGVLSNRYSVQFTANIIMYLMINYYEILFEKGEELTLEKIEDRLDMLFDFIKRGLS